MAELILGGQKSGKSRRAELLARDWLAGDAARSAVLIATAPGHDDEMRARIARHRADRAARVPGLATVEEPLRLAETIVALSTPRTLLVVDCLTLWLTNRLMPLAGPSCTAQALEADLQALEEAVRRAGGPLLLVGNEIGLGVVPMGREVRAFVDALGLLNQRMAACCARVTLMAAGLPLVLKDGTA
ncbi:bifunctional adenosylcobinamide kinase/adenosylcobinamide-phosphate guanylyltransferase [Pseudorhodoferax sp. Leaf274]|uniref:bifunctional adenosylcobinamide kinase/adenosylcobinamide-phosphate guanylyltransferase n=1 Tax=Pseudorhodoferax sp. Leaf274 TaxID=1736318 RepID=UPI0007023EC7|nr:bifunctional adenosylcobinamide kinase/adenosylcobinamide-phosphate guanylyltransferase [Pseudorhodoferax sp. Leaf274]KQP44568.1 adenosylcobinamide-phosphate guanylyltransferase [Pseudorhodoferax sp. Leaf274]